MTVKFKDHEEIVFERGKGVERGERHRERGREIEKWGYRVDVYIYIYI